MELKISDIFQVLECDLGRGVLKRYTVSQFCQSAELSRSSFYRHYKDINSIFAEYISCNFHKIFSSPKYKTDLTKYKLFINHLYEKRLIYQNIYELASGRLFIKKVLTDLFKPIISYKYNQAGLISDDALMMLCQAIAGVFLDTIDEGFVRTKEEVLERVSRVIAVAENVQKLL